MKKIKLIEQFLLEEKPKGAPDWHDSDAPDAEGRFKELGIKDLAAWLIKTRDKDLKKITGSLNQQIVFNRKDDPEYADKMEKVRKEVYKQLGREDLMEESEFKGYLSGDVADDIANNLSYYVKGIIQQPNHNYTYLHLKNRSDSSKVIKALKDIYGLKGTDGGKDFWPSTTVKFSNDEIVESISVSEGTFNSKNHIASLDDGEGSDAEVYKDGKGYYVVVSGEYDYDFDAKDKNELEKKLKSNGFKNKPYSGTLESVVVEEEGRDTLAELNEMTLGQLERIEDYAEMIEERMESGQQLESWMYSQITIALENLNAVHDALAGEEELEEGLTLEKAEGDRGPIDNPDIEKALKTKAEESGISIGLLRIVMRRGMDAWNRSHYEGTTQEQWGYARVNGFIKKEKGTWGGADADVAKEVKESYQLNEAKIKTISKKDSNWETVVASNRKEYLKIIQDEVTDFLKSKFKLEDKRVTNMMNGLSVLYTPNYGGAPDTLEVNLPQGDDLDVEKIAKETEKFLNSLIKKDARIKEVEMSLSYGKKPVAEKHPHFNYWKIKWAPVFLVW